MHPFGRMGRDFNGVDFHMEWPKHRAARGAGPLSDHWMAEVAARGARVRHPAADPRTPLGQLAYAFHFDAAFLRKRAEAGGVVRVKRKGRGRRAGRRHGTCRHAGAGRRIDGELFVDCSGFRSLLLGQEMSVDDGAVVAALRQMRTGYAKAAAAMPGHADYLRRR